MGEQYKIIEYPLIILFIVLGNLFLVYTIVTTFVAIIPKISILIFLATGVGNPILCIQTIFFFSFILLAYYVIPGFKLGRLLVFSVIARSIVGVINYYQYMPENSTVYVLISLALVLYFFTFIFSKSKLKFIYSTLIRLGIIILFWRLIPEFLNVLDLKLLLSSFLFYYNVEVHSFSDFIDSLNNILKDLNLYNFESGMPGNNGPNGDECALALSILQSLDPDSSIIWYDTGRWNINNKYPLGNYPYYLIIPKDDHINIFDRVYKTDYLQSIIFKYNEKLSHDLLNKSYVVDLLSEYDTLQEQKAWMNTNVFMMTEQDRALEYYNSHIKISLRDSINKHVILMRAYMWHDDNTLGNEYKEAYDFYQCKQIKDFLWNTALQHELNGTTPEQSQYISDMTKKEILYNELCVDLLWNQLDILTCKRALDISSNFSSDITAENIYKVLSPVMQEFKDQFSMEYNALNLNYKEQYLSKKGSDQLIYLFKNWYPKDILIDNKPIKTPNVGDVGLGLGKEFAFRDHYKYNPWFKDIDHRLKLKPDTSID